MIVNEFKSINYIYIDRDTSHFAVQRVWGSQDRKSRIEIVFISVREHKISDPNIIAIIKFDFIQALFQLINCT
jgi:hypothetical protein